MMNRRSLIRNFARHNATNMFYSLQNKDDFTSSAGCKPCTWRPETSEVVDLDLGDSWTMAQLIYITKMATLLMTMLTLIEAYSEGPPVEKYSEICDSMSPLIGHHAEPNSTSPPFEIRSLTTSNCYKPGQPVTGEYNSIRLYRVSAPAPPLRQIRNPAISQIRPSPVGAKFLAGFGQGHLSLSTNGDKCATVNFGGNQLKV